MVEGYLGQMRARNRAPTLAIMKTSSILMTSWDLTCHSFAAFVGIRVIGRPIIDRCRLP